MISKTEHDFLIVGQGIAGTLLAHFLLKRGQRVLIIDKHHVGASSKVAAGIINPITGRRVVKSWMIDELLPFAKTTYQDISSLLGHQYYQDRNILRVLKDAQDENLWHSKTAYYNLEKYVATSNENDPIKKKVKHSGAYGEITQSGQVNLPRLIEDYRKYFLQQDIILEETFNYDQLTIHESQITYQSHVANQIIFCEGHQARLNPWFQYLPFEVAKGEMLIIRIPNSNFQKTLKYKIFLVPLGDDLYWLGSTYDWDNLNELATAAKKQDLIDRLQKSIDVEFEVLEHLAAIRPTVKDRRPFLGRHPQFQQLCIFNGMGTKGASLTPYWANEMVSFLLDQKALSDEVNIQRIL